MSGARRSRDAWPRVSPLYAANLQQLGDDDIVIASYGGCGQSLLGNLLLELGLNYVDPYIEALHRDGRCEEVVQYSGYRRRLAAVRRRSPVPRTDGNNWPRFVKTHLPPSVFLGTDIAGVWLLVRDPRDALYSWHQWRLALAEETWDQVPPSFHDFLRNRDSSGGYPVEDWCAFYLDWMDEAAIYDATATTRFEDLKLQPVDAVRKALHAFGVDTVGLDLSGAAERSTFDAMRVHEDRVADCDPRAASGGRIMRSGKVNGWSEWLTPELAECFAAERTVDVARRFGYALP